MSPAAATSHCDGDYARQSPCKLLTRENLLRVCRRSWLEIICERARQGDLSILSGLPPWGRPLTSLGPDVSPQEMEKMLLEKKRVVRALRATHLSPGKRRFCALTGKVSASACCCCWVGKPAISNSNLYTLPGAGKINSPSERAVILRRGFVRALFFRARIWTVGAKAHALSIQPKCVCKTRRPSF
jgi:hypothetical protein